MSHHSKKKNRNTREAKKAQTPPARLAPQAIPIARKFVGYKPMKASRHAKAFATPAGPTPGALPTRVDLRPMMPPVLDQGNTSSCVANATAGSYDYWVKRVSKRDYDVSRMFVYYNARWSAGDQDKDDGSVIQLAMEGLQKFGACSEASWPFKKSLLTRKPNRQAYAEAAQAKIKEMAHVETTLDAWKHALASGYPIVFGCILFDSFDDCSARGGVVPMPRPEELTRAEHGGHSMCCVGYSDAEKVFIVRNSWGSEWGDHGYCYMPYAYLMNAKFNDGDSWVFVPETPLAAPEGAWFHDDGPVTNGGAGVDFDINPYADDAYDGIDFSPLIRWALDWFEDRPAEVTRYADLVQEEQFDELDHFSLDEVLASSPDEDSLESWQADEEGSEADAEDGDADEGDSDGDGEDDDEEDEGDSDADGEDDEEDDDGDEDDDGEDDDDEDDDDEDDDEDSDDEDDGEEDDGEGDDDEDDDEEEDDEEEDDEEVDDEEDEGDEDEDESDEDDDDER